MIEITEIVATAKIIPVLIVPDAAAAIPLAESLKAGGLPCAEVTFRTPAALETIQKMATVTGMLVGAGTVTTPKQVKDAVEAGAHFIVSPGYSPLVAVECREADVFYVPGVATPTEIMTALSDDISTLKFFPAEASGGIKMLTALTAPFPEVTFVPTGGIDEKNVSDYLAIPAVVACGGSWMAPKALIADKNWSEIEKRTSEVVRIVQNK